jgi:hypothetical protein
MAAYSFLDTKCAIVGPGGAFALTGGSAKEGIEVEMREDKNKMQIGADGTVMHSLRADKSAKITVRLLKNSVTNSLLSAMYNFQTTSAKLWGQNIISITSGIGEELTAQQVAFTKQPKMVWSEDGNINEWIFDAGITDELLAIGLL